MALSEQEQKALREIEQSLMADDPKFGSQVASVSGFGGSGSGFNLRGIAIIVVGLVLLVGGVALAQQSMWFIVLSILGFLTMFGAGVWMLRAGRASSRSGFGIEGGRAAERRSRKSGAGSLSARMEENFNKRFDDH